MEISQNFAAFSEYMDFTLDCSNWVLALKNEINLVPRIAQLVMLTSLIPERRGLSHLSAV